VARYDSKKIRELLLNEGIIRNRLKIEAAVQKEFGSFAAYVWGFVGGKPIKNSWQTEGQVPAKTRESTILSNDLKRRGFEFVGPTICYAFMQAVGMVNDHTVDCFRYDEV
jgi:DNA-3-methyladenine glycosylase I